MNKQIYIIDYGVGNLGSISNILQKVGAEPKFLKDPNDKKSIDMLILPGVGSFDYCANRLKKNGFFDLLNEFKDTGKPIIGVCVGAQLMCSYSEEGNSYGLNWFDSKVCKFKFSNQTDLKVPHMGWNSINILRDHKIIQGIDVKNRFYFLHSYYIDSETKNNVLAETFYGNPFNSIIEKENIIGIQFHPEKSHKYGIKLFENIIEI